MGIAAAAAVHLALNWLSGALDMSAMLFLRCPASEITLLLRGASATAAPSDDDDASSSSSWMTGVSAVALSLLQCGYASVP